jgi:hypothetical protein
VPGAEARSTPAHDARHDRHPDRRHQHLHEQLDPIDAARGRWEAEGSGEPGADERATIPTAIVSQIGMRCLPGTTSRPSAPTMTPIAPAGEPGDIVRVTDGHAVLFLLPAEFDRATEADLRYLLAREACAHR